MSLSLTFHRLLPFTFWQYAKKMHLTRWGGESPRIMLLSTLKTSYKIWILQDLLNLRLHLFQLTNKWVKQLEVSSGESSVGSGFGNSPK